MNACELWDECEEFCGFLGAGITNEKYIERERERERERETKLNKVKYTTKCTLI